MTASQNSSRRSRQAHPDQGRRLRHADPGQEAAGGRLSRHARPAERDQHGNNDLLNLTRPEIVRSICESFADAGADILATNTFNANRDQPGRLWRRALVGRDQPVVGARSSAKSPTATRRMTAGSAGSPARSGRPTRPCRCRRMSTIPASAKSTFDKVKAVYREQIDALVEGGVDFILIETVFDTLNAKAAIMAALEAEQALGPRTADHDFDDPHRPFGPQPFGPYGRGLLGLGAPRPAADDRPQLLVRRGAAAPAPRGAGARSPTRWSWPIPMPALPNELGEYDEAAEETAAQVREWADAAASSTSSAAAAARRPRISPPLPGRCAIARRAPSRHAARGTLLAGLEPMLIAA